MLHKDGTDLNRRSSAPEIYSTGESRSFEPPRHLSSVEDFTNRQVNAETDGWSCSLWHNSDWSEGNETNSYKSPPRKIPASVFQVEVQTPEDLESAVDLYSPPEGYTWRTVVVDTLNFMSCSIGTDWLESGKAGQLMAEFAIFMTQLGCPKVIFVITRGIVDRWLSMPPSDDRHIFLHLWKRECIVIAPSWCSPQQVNKITGGCQKALSNFGDALVRKHKNVLKLNDDLTVVKVAEMIDAIIISRDKFRDQKRYHGQRDLEKILTYAVGARVDAIYLGPGCWKLNPARKCYGGKHMLPFYKPLLLQK